MTMLKGGDLDGRYALLREGTARARDARVGLARGSAEKIFKKGVDKSPNP